MQTLTETPETVKTEAVDMQLVEALATRMAARHPELAAMADRAAAIVARGGVRRVNRWQIEVTGDTGVYDVQLDDELQVVGCTCPAWYYRPATVGGKQVCKHIVAYALTERAREMGR